MNKNVILFLVLAAAAAIAYFILSAPTEQQPGADGSAAAGAGATGLPGDTATTLGTATGGNALDGLLSTLMTTPNPGIASNVVDSEILIGSVNTNFGVVKIYASRNNPNNVLYILTEGGKKLLPNEDQFKSIIQSLQSSVGVKV